MVRRNDEQMLPRPGFHYHLQESAYTGPQKRDNHRLLQHFGPWPGPSGAATMQRDGGRLLLRLAQRGNRRTRGRHADHGYPAHAVALPQLDLRRDVLRRRHTAWHVWPDRTDRRVVRREQPL